MSRAVLLLSSGLDSAANLELAGEAGFQIAMALTINYGQRGAARELEHAAVLSRHYKVEHLALDFSSFSNLVGGRSALLGAEAIPVPGSLDDLSVTTKTAAAVWVPNRNGVLISIAAAVAESRGFNAVAVGFNAEEAVTFPDNTVEYMDSMTRSLEYSTSNRVEVISATAQLSKQQIVAKLAGSGFPFEQLWSCYHAGEQHCGRCESCQRLRRALERGLPQSDSHGIMSKLFGLGGGL